jgi:LCP family protein required for cell wall assembly
MNRRLRAWLICTLVALGLLAAGGFAAAWAYGRSINAGLQRTDAFSGVPSSSRPVVTATKAMNVLLLGSDSRNPDTTATSRSDTLMLLHLDTDHKHAYTISIPRDTWVHVPTSADGQNGGTMAKINAAYAWGGAPLAVRTVEEFTGVHVDHVVVIDFAGVQQVVDALGGVDMTVDQTIKSIHPPYRTYAKGPRHFTGAEALDYVRQRYQFADGDFSRDRHQQQLLQALMDKATSTGTLANPVELDGFLRAASKSVTVDKGFDLMSVAMQLRDLRSSDITFMTNPTTGTAWEGDQSVVRSDTERAKALYQAVADDTVAQWLATQTPSPAPSAG